MKYLLVISFLFLSLSAFSQVGGCSETGPGNNCVADTYECEFSADQGFKNNEIAATMRLTVNAPAKVVAVDPKNPNSPAVWASIETLDNNETFKGYISFSIHFVTDISQFNDEGGLDSAEHLFGYTSFTALIGTQKAGSMSGRNNISNGDSYSSYCELVK